MLCVEIRWHHITLNLLSSSMCTVRCLVCFLYCLAFFFVLLRRWLCHWLVLFICVANNVQICFHWFLFLFASFLARFLYRLKKVFIFSLKEINFDLPMSQKSVFIYLSQRFDLLQPPKRASIAFDFQKERFDLRPPQKCDFHSSLSLKI